MGGVVEAIGDAVGGAIEAVGDIAEDVVEVAAPVAALRVPHHRGTQQRRRDGRCR